MFRVAINGFGRIGRNILRAYYERLNSGESLPYKIIAVNDLGDAEINAHLMQYDTAHGRFAGEVTLKNNNLVVNGDKIAILSERIPYQLPWSEMNVDLVLECTGHLQVDCMLKNISKQARNVCLYLRLRLIRTQL